MKANEIRIGNLFDYHGQTVHVMAIDKVSAEFGYFVDSIGFERTFGSPDFPKEIPLTEEWLVGVGFVKSINYLSLKHELFELDYNADGDNEFNLCIGIYCSNGCDLPNLKFVNQLQNLYFSLTGNELEAI